MEILTYDDIVGGGTVVQLITLLKIGGVLQVQANWDTKWYQLVMLASTGTSRMGPSTISATNGIPIGTPNNGQFAPPIAFATDRYDFRNVYVLIKTGDTLSVSRAT
jgi:hypothetical protein